MKIRKCNEYGCDGTMRPTKDFVSYNKDHRIFRCVVCGNLTPWLDKPKEGSTAFASLHMTNDGASVLSMMSDPEMYPPKLVRRKR